MSVIKWIKRKRHVLIQKYRLNRMPKEGVRLQYVEIETINKCNGKCSFCPVNVNRDIRERKVMDESLFYKIIGDLKFINYTGRLALFSNNEPLLDKRIVSFAQYARQELPNATIYMYTNGKLLTKDILRKLLEVLDFVHIDNYNDEGVINTPIEEAINGVKDDKKLLEKIELVYRKENEILTSRGGLNSKDSIDIPKCGCTLPFIQLVVRPDGLVSLCCNDCYGQWTMGDVKQNSIEEIWRGESLQQVRKLLKNDRHAVTPCCSGCDNIDNRSIDYRC